MEIKIMTLGNKVYLKVTVITFNYSTVTDTIKRKTRTCQKCIVLNFVNFEDDKMSINLYFFE